MFSLRRRIKNTVESCVVIKRPREERKRLGEIFPERGTPTKEKPTLYVGGGLQPLRSAKKTSGRGKQGKQGACSTSSQDECLRKYKTGPENSGPGRREVESSAPLKAAIFLYLSRSFEVCTSVFPQKREGLPRIFLGSLLDG